ncbi:hypothetical protein LCGC14_2838650, partial [marine sediment metagenome]
RRGRIIATASIITEVADFGGNCFSVCAASKGGIIAMMRPLAAEAASLTAVSIPGEAATLPAQATAKAAREVGFEAAEAESVTAALEAIIAREPHARVLICGSLYLAGSVLRESV